MADASLLWRENQRLRVRILILESELAGASGVLRGIATVMRDEGEEERAAILEDRASELWALSTPKKEIAHG